MGWPSLTVAMKYGHPNKEHVFTAFGRNSTGDILPGATHAGSSEVVCNGRVAPASVPPYPHPSRQDARPRWAKRTSLHCCLPIHHFVPVTIEHSTE
jgi:hypothetical protein